MVKRGPVSNFAGSLSYALYPFFRIFIVLVLNPFFLLKSSIMNFLEFASAVNGEALSGAAINNWLQIEVDNSDKTIPPAERPLKFVKVVFGLNSEVGEVLTDMTAASFRVEDINFESRQVDFEPIQAPVVIDPGTGGTTGTGSSAGEGN